MPEGHVIHGQARRLARAFRGQVVRVDSPQGRFTEAGRVDGAVVHRAWARGKHLFVEFARQDSANGRGSSAAHEPIVPTVPTVPTVPIVTLHVHLGLFGTWTFGSGAAPAVTGQVRCRIRTRERFAELRGPTVCELLDQQQVDAVLQRIGPDPLHRAADPNRAWQRLQRSSAPIGAALMDQRTFAGVGNIYRAEVLFRHRMSPFRPARAVTREDFDALWQDLVHLMAQGARRGRIDTVQPEHLPATMGRPTREDRHGGEVYVYRRAGQPCLLCSTPVSASSLQSRNLYWCPDCQAR